MSGSKGKKIYRNVTLVENADGTFAIENVRRWRNETTRSSRWVEGGTGKRLASKLGIAVAS